MLRITPHEDPPAVLLRLEGRLAGPSVAVLDDCRRGVPGGTRLRLDLAGVTFIDDAGKSLLADLHRSGAEFVAGNLVTRAVVAEIVGP